MSKKLTGEQLRAALAGELDELFDETAEALNQARPGKIIADSEEAVRDAAAEFRKRLFEKGLELRQRTRRSFSPLRSRRGRGGGGTRGSRRPVI